MKVVDKFYNKSPRIRETLMNLIYGNKDVLIDLCGVKTEVNTIKENGYLRASKLSSQSSLLRDEIPIFLSLSMILGKGDSFVDVGANIGIFSSIIARYKPFLDLKGIYAFEANPNTFERLEKNSNKYDFSAFNVGISSKEEHLEFVAGAVSHVFTTVGNSSKYNIKSRSMIVKCQPLSHFHIEGDSIVLKIDVEGQELNVLEGARPLFNEQRIKAVYFDGFTNHQKCLSFLKEYNFLLFDGKDLTESDGNLFSLFAISAKEFDKVEIS